MPIYGYVGIAYLIIINIITLAVYAKEANEPQTRIAAPLLLLLPIIGGSLGAIFGNFFLNTEHRELRSWLWKYLSYVPPVMFILQFIAIIYMLGARNCFMYLWEHAYARAGIIGYVLVIINILAFVFVIIRKSSYFIAPHGNYLIPDLILVPILVLGGATGGVIAKILFNFKEDWSCNALMEVQNFIYNAGMFVMSAIHIGLFVYFFYIR